MARAHRALATGRGVLADRDRQSEVRQFLLHAALKRADELNRLRDLPDTPTRSEVEDTTPKVAGLPSNRSDSDPEEAATINETPVVSIPIEIGEPAAVELPAVVPQAQPQEMAPAAKKAEAAKPQREPTAASIAHATPKSQRSRRRLASTLSLKCFSGDRRLNQPQNSQLPAYAQQGGQHQYQPAYTQRAGRQRYYQGPTNGAAQTSQHTYSSAPGTTPY
jgi:hypothetical protein